MCSEMPCVVLSNEEYQEWKQDPAHARCQYRDLDAFSVAAYEDVFRETPGFMAAHGKIQDYLFGGGVTVRKKGYVFEDPLVQNELLHFAMQVDAYLTLFDFVICTRDLRVVDLRRVRLVVAYDIDMSRTYIVLPFPEFTKEGTRRAPEPLVAPDGQATVLQEAFAFEARCIDEKGVPWSPVRALIETRNFQMMLRMFALIAGEGLAEPRWATVEQQSSMLEQDTARAYAEAEDQHEVPANKDKLIQVREVVMGHNYSALDRAKKLLRDGALNPKTMLELQGKKEEYTSLTVPLPAGRKLDKPPQPKAPDRLDELDDRINIEIAQVMGVPLEVMGHSGARVSAEASTNAMALFTRTVDSHRVKTTIVVNAMLMIRYGEQSFWHTVQQKVADITKRFRKAGSGTKKSAKRPRKEDGDGDGPGDEDGDDPVDENEVKAALKMEMPSRDEYAIHAWFPGVQDPTMLMTAYNSGWLEQEDFFVLYARAWGVDRPTLAKKQRKLPLPSPLYANNFLADQNKQQQDSIGLQKDQVDIQKKKTDADISKIKTDNEVAKATMNAPTSK